MARFDDVLARRFGPSAPGGSADSGLARLRWLVFPAVFLAYLGQTASGVDRYAHGWGRVVGFALIALFCVVYLVTLQASRHQPTEPSRAAAWGTAALVAICVLEVPFAHQDAFVMLIYVLVLAISRLGARALPLVVAAFLASTFLPALVPSWDQGVEVDLGVSMLVVAFAMWAFFGVIRVNRELGAARAEVAQLAAEAERSRIARDLHDLLGHSLTAVTVKAGLARRLVATDPERAASEIGEVEDLARRSLADVRAAISGYREVTLAGELASGRELLRAAGIDAALPRAVEVEDPAHAVLFGWAVREGLTNVVRHARARRCEVRVGPTWVEVVDDSVVDGAAGGAAEGNGLQGLRDRVAEAGATLAVGPRSGGGWHLRVDAAPAGGRVRS